MSDSLSISVPAYAKINLSLDILGKRPDGYHEVCMIMQSLKLHDTISIQLSLEPTQSANSGLMPLVTLTCTSTGLPSDKKNLAFRAADAFFALYHTEITRKVKSCSITLEKKIPVAAGLAGGSSDAAAVLYGLYCLCFHEGKESCRSELPEELYTLASKLGADIPYCLRLSTVLSEGIGEKLTPLTPAEGCCCLLVKPASGASTKQIYEAFDTYALANTVDHPDTKKLLYALQEKNFVLMCGELKNVLEPVTNFFVPEITAIKEELSKLHADAVLMSGSGPTVFGLFKDSSAAERAKKTLVESKRQWVCILTEFTSA